MLNPFLVLFIFSSNNDLKNNDLSFNNKYDKPNNEVWDLYKKILLLEKIKVYKYVDYTGYQIFNLFYLKHIYNINLKERSINAISILPAKLNKYILFKTRYMHFKQFNIKYFNEVAYMFLVNVWLKNSKNICKYIKTKLDNVHFKRHKSYFLFFLKILRRFITPNLQILGIKGITLKFKGKLGRGGNARKKTMFYGRGCYSLSNKLLCLNKNSWDVWTKTGTVGCTFQIFY